MGPGRGLISWTALDTYVPMRDTQDMDTVTDEFVWMKTSSARRGMRVRFSDQSEMPIISDPKPRGGKSDSWRLEFEDSRRNRWCLAVLIRAEDLPDGARYVADVGYYV